MLRLAQLTEAHAASRGLRNVEIITCDLNDLLAHVVTRMQPAATLFVHIFTPREYAYAGGHKSSHYLIERLAPTAWSSIGSSIRFWRSRLSAR